MINNILFQKGLKINYQLILFFCTAILLMSSCKSYNLLQNSSSVDYFEEMKNERFDGYVSSNPKAYQKNKNKQETYILKPGDKVSVSVWNHDDLSVGSIFSNYNSNEVYGKWILVNSQGDVTLPEIGKVRLIDLTVEEAEKKLSDIYVKLIVEPLVVVKVLNKEITILGEVNRPGKVLLEKDEMTLYEVLGLVGGLGDFADSRSIKLIRNSKEYNIDLTEVTAREFTNIGIKSSDLIYVPSQKSKPLIQKSPVLIPIASAITVVLLLITSFNKN